MIPFSLDSLLLYLCRKTNCTSISQEKIRTVRAKKWKNMRKARNDGNPRPISIQFYENHGSSVKKTIKPMLIINWFRRVDPSTTWPMPPSSANFRLPEAVDFLWFLLFLANRQIGRHGQRRKEKDFCSFPFISVGNQVLFIAGKLKSPPRSLLNRVDSRLSLKIQAEKFVQTKNLQDYVGRTLWNPSHHKDNTIMAIYSNRWYN